MIRSKLLLRHATQAIPSTSTPDYLPSKGFMHVKVKRPSQKKKFVQVASEVEMFKDHYGNEELQKLEINDEKWGILMEMSWEDRCSYMMAIRKSQKSAKVENESTTPLISETNMNRLKSGEMVYARYFHSLLDIYGADFRRQIDTQYGINCMNNEKTTNFIVDCRFLRDYSVDSQAYYTYQMQELHNDNWKSKTPFPIHFANYQPNEQLATIAKKSLLFRYGPKWATNFKPHPFAPIITPRKIDSIVNSKDDIMYISSKATRFVPDILPDNIKGVVYCLSNDYFPHTSSMSACISDRIVPYRIPFKKYISEKLIPSKLSLSQIGMVFRDYIQGMSIRESLLNNKDKLIWKPYVDANNEKDEGFRSAMHHINNCSQSNHT